MANYNFNSDINLGKQGESIVIQDLEYLGAKFISSNDTNTHDFIMTFKNKEVKYECKTDVFHDTGNMFIETHCRNHKSGILVTQAEWFVTYFSKMNEIWYIKTKNLLKIINDNEHKMVENVGDLGSKTKGYLINKNMFRKHFIVRNSITHKEIIPKWLKELNSQ